MSNKQFQPNVGGMKFVVKILEMELKDNGRWNRLCKCWCGKIIKFTKLRGHLHRKHKQKREEITIE